MVKCAVGLPLFGQPKSFTEISTNSVSQNVLHGVFCSWSPFTHFRVKTETVFQASIFTSCMRSRLLSSVSMWERVCDAPKMQSTCKSLLKHDQTNSINFFSVSCVLPLYNGVPLPEATTVTLNGKNHVLLMNLTLLWGLTTLTVYTVCKLLLQCEVICHLS